jgi:hypothetical protein
MKARHIFSELDLIYTNSNLLEDAMHKVDDATVVGSASKINMLREQFMVLDKKLIKQNPASSFKLAHSTNL